MNDTPTLPDPTLSPRFTEALAYAQLQHWTQVRKGSAIPYLSHLLQVCGLVLEAGGDEDQAIAALLHDSIEDAAPGQADVVRAQIGGRFGPRVLELVEACTDTDVHPKPPWEPRRRAYLAHLMEVDAAALLVSSADKLHNARAILRDFRTHGPALWERFSAPAPKQLWYYRSLVETYRARGGTPLVDELDEVVTALEREVVG